MLIALFTGVIVMGFLLVVLGIVGLVICLK